MTKYQYYKNLWREKAIQWQNDLPNIASHVLSYDYYIHCQCIFERAAHNYGLTKEFKENAII